MANAFHTRNAYAHVNNEDTCARFLLSSNELYGISSQQPSRCRPVFSGRKHRGVAQFRVSCKNGQVFGTRRPCAHAKQRVVAKETIDRGGWGEIIRENIR